MPNVPAKAVITDTPLFLSGVKLLRIELAHNLELLIRRRLGHAEMLGKLQGKSGIFLELLATHSRIERDHLHALLVLIKPEYGEIGDHAKHAPGQKPAEIGRAHV